MIEELAAKQDRTAYYRAYREANPEKIAAINKTYHAANPAAAAERIRSNHATRINRRPSWYDRAACVTVYQMARDMTLATGVPHEVDHILPLNGKLVSGLHVAANLQVLTAAANQSKGSSYTLC